MAASSTSVRIRAQAARAAADRRVAHFEDVQSLEAAGYEQWLRSLAPSFVRAPLAERHHAMLDWGWNAPSDAAPDPLIACFPRGGGKSTMAELLAVILGARGLRKYGLYVCGTQDQADEHVTNIGGLLESTSIASVYPDMAARATSKYGQSQGWRTSRLRTRSGWGIDALGLNSSARGKKSGADRPDFCIIDDIDDDLDSATTTKKKIQKLTRKILPTLAPNALILVVQNLVHADSVVAQLIDGRAGFLLTRRVLGPYKAIENLEYEIDILDNGLRAATITGGTPTWAGQDIAACQAFIYREGIDAFLAESQQEVDHLRGDIWQAEWLDHVAPTPALGVFDRVVQGWDTAVAEDDSAAYSVCVTAGLYQNKAYILDVFRKRIDSPTLLREAKRLDELWQPDVIVIENKSSGQGLAQWIKRETQIPAVPVPALGSKEYRARKVTPYFESGRVIICKGPWNREFRRELLAFPIGPTDDQVDAVVHTLMRLFGRQYRKAKSQ